MCCLMLSQKYSSSCLILNVIKKTHAFTIHSCYKRSSSSESPMNLSCPGMDRIKNLFTNRFQNHLIKLIFDDHKKAIHKITRNTNTPTHTGLFAWSEHWPSWIAILRNTPASAIEVPEHDPKPLKPKRVKAGVLCIRKHKRWWILKLRRLCPP